ncbi:Alpha/beta hydrolase fold-3 [Dillenia turbinata]|uniref:Alpha/beta hydrolase fold-3 n=1 Tax=Dillenia turbinata TaxID=194707 RepID=A0AAN8Z4L8_9MAGN
MSDQTAAPNHTADPYEYLHIIPNPDGTIGRPEEFYTITKASCDPTQEVISRDLVFNQSNNTWVRLYLPTKALDSTSNPSKLPLIIYIRGGGFIIGSAGTTIIHDFCNTMAADLFAVVLSVEYRSAPEHRLPAAYDDCMEALHCIKTIPDEWLRDYADYSNCFVMGTSAGGNIAYHAGLRVAADIDHFRPLQIKGLILHQPFFGGSKRSGSELRSKDPVLPLFVTDLMWGLSLPIGSTRDHDYCNPTVGDDSKKYDPIKALGWRVMVTGYSGDTLFDRQIQIAQILEDAGLEVVTKFEEGGFHGADVLEPSKALELFVAVKNFISLPSKTT